MKIYIFTHDGVYPGVYPVGACSVVMGYNKKRAKSNLYTLLEGIEGIVKREDGTFGEELVWDNTCKRNKPGKVILDGNY